jgi:hypothetical protein
MNHSVVPLGRREMLLVGVGATSAVVLGRESPGSTAGGTASRWPELGFKDLQSGLLTAWVRLVAGRPATVQLAYFNPRTAAVEMSKSIEVPGQIMPACQEANMLALNAVAQSWNVAVESLNRSGDHLLHPESGRTITCRVWADVRAA